MRITCCTILLLTAVACGGDQKEPAKGKSIVAPTLKATLTDHSKGLTHHGSDPLFLIEITEAGQDYRERDLFLTYNKPGGKSYHLYWTLVDDLNQDNRLSQGDILLGAEPGPHNWDHLGPRNAGQEFEVQLFQMRGEEMTLIWSGTWIADEEV